MLQLVVQLVCFFIFMYSIMYTLCIMVYFCLLERRNFKSGQNVEFYKIKGDVGEAWAKYLGKHNPLFGQTDVSNVCGLRFDSVLDYEILSTSVNQIESRKTLCPGFIIQVPFNVVTAAQDTIVLTQLHHIQS